MKALLQIIYISLLSVSFLKSYAQYPVKNYDYQNMVWLGYFIQLELGERLFIKADYQFRARGTNEWSQKVFRQGLSYKLHEQVDIHVGFAYFHHHQDNFIQNEYRPYQEAVLYNTYGRFKVDNRYRFEQRIMQDIENNQLQPTFSFNYRARYKLLITLPIYQNQEESPWSVFLDNEVFVNFGRKILIDYFDQNRASLGFSYSFSERLRLQFSYMYIFDQTDEVGDFLAASVFRLNLYQKINLRKKEKE